MIYVLDASDTERYDEAKESICNILSSSELSKIPLLVYSNKSDIADKKPE